MVTHTSPPSPYTVRSSTSACSCPMGPQPRWRTSCSSSVRKKVITYSPRFRKKTTPGRGLFCAAASSNRLDNHKGCRVFPARRENGDQGWSATGRAVREAERAHYCRARSPSAFFLASASKANLFRTVVPPQLCKVEGHNCRFLASSRPFGRKCFAEKIPGRMSASRSVSNSHTGDACSKIMVILLAKSRPRPWRERLLSIDSGLLSQIGQNAAVHIQDVAVDKIDASEARNTTGPCQIVRLAPPACRRAAPEERRQGDACCRPARLAQGRGLGRGDVPRPDAVALNVIGPRIRRRCFW